MAVFYSSEDQKILDMFRAGEQKVLVDLYKSNFSMVKSYILKNKGNEADAEDVLQDALIVMWQNLQRPSFELTAKISTYLMAIVKNLWLKKLSKYRRETGEEAILPQMHSVLPDEGRNMDLRHIHEALHNLGETCQQILLLFYFDGLDMDTIAKQMSFANADTAKAKKYQCFKKLEEMVKKRYKASDFLR